MRGWRISLFVAAVAVSFPATASTELHPGFAGFPVSLVRDGSPTDSRGDLDAFSMRSASAPAAGDASSVDDWASAVDRVLLEGGNVAAPSSESRDRFKWVFMLIAFAGLTAAFAGRRSGGRGLITR